MGPQIQNSQQTPGFIRNPGTLDCAAAAAAAAGACGAAGRRGGGFQQDLERWENPRKEGGGYDKEGGFDYKLGSRES